MLDKIIHHRSNVDGLELEVFDTPCIVFVRDCKGDGPKYIVLGKHLGKQVTVIYKDGKLQVNSIIYYNDLANECGDIQDVIVDLSGDNSYYYYDGLWVDISIEYIMTMLDDDYEIF